MKKVILINSPIYDRKVADKEDYLPPLGLGYIATEMQNNDIEVEILDCVFHNYTVKEIINILNNENPDFVGINIFSVNFDLVKLIIEKYSGNTTFIVGGKAVKDVYKDILNFNTPNTIICVAGEGEYMDTAIVLGNVDEKPRFSKGETRKAYFVDKYSKYFPVDISKLKLNRKFFINREIVNPYGILEESIVTSRECIYNCAFCGAAHSNNKDTYSRSRSPEDIKSELTDIKQNNPQVKSIRILDDLFLRDRKSIQNAIDIFSNYDYEWRAMCHVKSLVSNLDMLDQLKESNCRELEIGVESGNDLMRNYIHKVGSVFEVKKVISAVLEHGINVKAYFILGLPTETLEQCLDTYKLAKEMSEYSKTTPGKFRVSAFQFRPYHGTELYNKIANNNLTYKINDRLEDKKRQQFNFIAGNFSQCTQEELDDLLNKMNNLTLNEVEQEEEQDECTEHCQL